MSLEILEENMRNIILLIGLAAMLSGCVMADYYTRPDSPGYTEQALLGQCENCNRIFNFSAYQYNNYSLIGCPFCGREQDIKLAFNRGAYAYQQAEAQQNQQALANFFQARQQHQQEYNQNQQQVLQNYQNSLNKQGSATNPIYFKEQK